MYSVLTIALAVVTFSYGFDWKGTNSALNCDFKANDLQYEKLYRYRCKEKCESTPECTHYVWVSLAYDNREVGNCYLKQGGAFKSEAVPSEDYSECGIIKFKSRGYSTNYWDCCKPSCAWSRKASVTNPVSSCWRDGFIDVSSPIVLNGCENRGGAHICNYYKPWYTSYSMSYGFATARIAGKTEAELCCKCFLLTFTSGQIAGKKMMIQVINTIIVPKSDEVTNPDEDAAEKKNRLDLLVPGSGAGGSDGCTFQWEDSGADLSDGVADGNDCAKLPWQLRSGCEWRYEWLKSTENPTFNFIESRCDQELTARSTCARV